MVFLHNKLNEDAWKEVLQWESRFHGGYEYVSVEAMDIHARYQRNGSGQARARIVCRHSWPPLEQGSLSQVGEEVFPFLFHVSVSRLRNIDSGMSSIK